MGSLSSVVQAKVDANLCLALMAGSVHRHPAQTLGNRHQGCRARHIFDHIMHADARIRICQACIELRLASSANPVQLAAGFCKVGPPQWDRTTRRR